MRKKIAVFRLVLDSLGSFGRAIARKPPRSCGLLPILAVLGNVVLTVLMVATAFGQATSNTTIQPDCLIPFTFTGAGNFPATNVTGGAGDNRTKGCAAWTLMYQNTGMTSVSVTLQSGSSVSTTVSYGSFAGTISTGFVNPIVSDTGGSLQAVNGTADISWVRVNVAATGSGTLTGVLYGFRNSSAAVNGGGGGGGACPNGAASEVQVTDGTNCVGNVNFQYTTGTLELGDACCFFSTSGLALNIASILTATGQSELIEISGDYDPTVDSQPNYGIFTIYGSVGGATNITTPGPANIFSALWSNFLTRGYNSGEDFTGTLDRAANLFLKSTLDHGTITEFADIWIVPGATGGTNATNYGLWMADKTGLATNIYYEWFDSRGVYRCREDAAFNSVGQSICALYNPQFTKYTPGAVDYERIVEQWESNEGWFRTEAGGTGTLRRMGLGSAGLDNSTSDVALPFVNGKMSASASAPGAGKADLRWLAGTNAGTCKLVSNAGTSATEVTIVDNIGSGC